MGFGLVKLLSGYEIVESRGLIGVSPPSSWSPPPGKVNRSCCCFPGLFCIRFHIVVCEVMIELDGIRSLPTDQAKRMSINKKLRAVNGYGNNIL